MNGATKMKTDVIPTCVHAYAAARGMDYTLKTLLDRLAGEKPTFHGLIDLGNGTFVSPLDTKVGLQTLAADHTHMATFNEVLDDVRSEDVDEEDDLDDDEDEDDLDFDDDEDEDDFDDDFEDDDLDDDFDDDEDEDDDDFDDSDEEDDD